MGRIKRYTGTMIDDDLNTMVIFSVGTNAGKVVSCTIADREIKSIKILGEEAPEYLQHIRAIMPATGKASFIWRIITKIYLSIKTEVYQNGTGHGRVAERLNNSNNDFLTVNIIDRRQDEIEIGVDP